MINKKKQESPSPVTTAVAGAVIGAGVAIVGAVLRNKENREKIKEVITNVKDQTSEYIQSMQEQVEDTQDSVEQKISEGTDKMEQIKKVVKS